MVGVAQLVEHLVVVQVVAGSSPVTHPKARATCVRGERGPGRLRRIVRVRSAPRERGLRHPHPLCAIASLGGRGRVCLSGYAFVSLGGLVGQLGWQDVRVKVSGSWWFGYGVVVVATFVIGFLGFAVWVLSKVF
jgi:hypothetical protein